jgi:mono/diheme cytochrome c family protein
MEGGAEMKLWCIPALCLLASCQKDEMADVPHFEPMEKSALFDNGASARVPPSGTVTRGNPQTDIPLNYGRKAGAKEAVAKSPLPFTAARLARGRELFDIHCAVCHGADGYADGIVVRRGFPPPPSYHSDRLRDAPDGHFFDVISNGYGKMYPYRSRLTVADRWAIVGYIRALQRGGHASLEDVADAAELSKLQAERSAP